MSTTDKILKEMEQMAKGGEGSGQRGHKTERNVQEREWQAGRANRIIAQIEREKE